MRIQLVVRVDLKDRPADFRGQTSETWVIKEEVCFEDAIVFIVEQLAEYYGLIYDADQLNVQRDRLADWLSRSRFEQFDDECTAN